MKDEAYCPACKETHIPGSDCWWMAHRRRNPECKCQWCHALGPVDVSYVKEYGLTQKLSNQVRVY